MTTNRQKTKECFSKYYDIPTQVSIHIKYLYTTLTIKYHTKGIIQYQRDRMTYKHNILPLYPNTYTSQPKNTHPILIPKYNILNNRMIHKIRPEYPKKCKIQQKTTNPTIKPKHNIPRYNTHIHNNKPRQCQYTTHMNHISHPPTYPQPYSKANPHTKHGRNLKQTPHLTNKIPTIIIGVHT